MIYHLSLQFVGIVCGLLLVGVSALALFGAGKIWPALARFPRSKIAGIILLTVGAIWSFSLVATMEMGEFSNFRRMLMFGLPIAYVLVLKFVDEFLAVRALGILCLLAAEPLLDAAFLRYESSRLLITSFAYALIIAGLFWVTMPYLLRDQISWSTRSAARWKTLASLCLLYGAAVLVCAFTRY